MRRSFTFVAFLLLALGTTGSVAYADEAVVNGGFETGDFTGWTLGLNAEFMFVSCAPSDGFTAPEGSCFALMGPVGSDGSLSQTIVDNSGENYIYSFAYASDGNTPNDFTAFWDGTPLLSVTDDSNHGWVDYQFPVTGTGSDIIEFDFRNDPGYDALDEVSLSPEPSSVLLFGSGLLLLAGLFRRRLRA
jgi:hypothetical protein